MLLLLFCWACLWFDSLSSSTTAKLLGFLSVRHDKIVIITLMNIAAVFTNAKGPVKSFSVRLSSGKRGCGLQGLFTEMSLTKSTLLRGPTHVVFSLSEVVVESGLKNSWKFCLVFAPYIFKISVQSSALAKGQNVQTDRHKLDNIKVLSFIYKKALTYHKQMLHSSCHYTFATS